MIFLNRVIHQNKKEIYLSWYGKGLDIIIHKTKIVILNDNAP